jgi:regulator of sirC expression with transglutaminase-like and TPR domain
VTPPRDSATPNAPDARQIANARERFAEIAARSDDDIELADAALWLAAEACADLDVDGALARIHALANEASERLSATASREERIAAVNETLFVAHAFQGERVDYYDVRNSFLNHVLERRRGIPIALCVLYVTVARRAGLAADGVSFPGHFLAKIRRSPEGAPEVIIDAFERAVITHEDCRERLKAAFGPEAVLAPEMLRSASNKEVLFRMLGNLKAVYMNGQQFEEALGCCDRALLLVPDAPQELRDRGLVYHRLDCTRPAVTDLERYVELAPDDPSIPAVRKLLGELRQQLPRVH